MYTQSLLFVLAQCMHTALLRAAQGGSVTLVRLLLEKYGSSVDEAEKVSTEYMYLHNTHIPTQTHSQSQII